MKKLSCLCLAFLFLLGCAAGCSSNPPADTTASESTASEATEVTQSPEEAAVFKVLMIGQSLAQDTVWLLYDVLKAEMPDKEFLVADIYDSITLGDHRINILTNYAVYDYIVNKDGKMVTTKNYTITAALKDQQWDLIIFNDATYPTTQAAEFKDGDHDFMIKHIAENAAPGYKLAYNATWANPTSAGLYAPERRQPPANFRENFFGRFQGSRNEYYRLISENIKTYIETDTRYDYVFHSGTAIQYASETHGVPEADPTRVYDLYRDYVHLSDFGRLIVAYQLYAQIFGLEELTQVNVNLIPQAMRATAREQAFGNLTITDTHKQAIIASVNYALQNPNTEPPQTFRPAATLEPLS